MASFNAYKSLPKCRCPYVSHIMTHCVSAFTNFKILSTLLYEPRAIEKNYFVSKYLGIFQIVFNYWFLVKSLVRENTLYGRLLLHLLRLVLLSRIRSRWASLAHLTVPRRVSGHRAGHSSINGRCIELAGSAVHAFYICTDFPSACSVGVGPGGPCLQL